MWCCFTSPINFLIPFGTNFSVLTVKNVSLMYKLTNRNHYYNSNGMNNDPSRSKRRGYQRENDRSIGERIYKPGYDTTREYNRGDSYRYTNDSDIYENEFVHEDQRDRGYDQPRWNRRRRNEDGFFNRVGRNIRHAWDNLRHHDDPDINYYYDDDELEERRQRTRYYADNDFDSVYNAANENSYEGYERRRNPYNYQDEFDNRFNDFEWDRNYNSVNDRRYNAYDRGRDEFDLDRKRSLRKRRAKFSMDL
jgi:hypothetical protein